MDRALMKKTPTMHYARRPGSLVEIDWQGQDWYNSLDIAQFAQVVSYFNWKWGPRYEGWTWKGDRGDTYAYTHAPTYATR